MNTFSFISLRVAVTCVSCVVSHPYTISTTPFLNTQKNKCHDIKLDLPKSKRIFYLQHRSNNHCVCSPLWIMIYLWQNIYFNYLWHSKGWWRNSKKKTQSSIFFSSQTRSLWTPSCSQFAALCRPWHKEKEYEGSSSASLSLIFQVKKAGLSNFSCFVFNSVPRVSEHALSKNYAWQFWIIKRR